jgi:hypothetical protein
MSALCLAAAPGPVLECSAVLISALVGDARDELGQQVAVGRMDLVVNIEGVLVCW